MANTRFETLVEAAAGLPEIDACLIRDESQVAAALGLLQRNQSALEIARRALGPECIVPVRDEVEFFHEHLDHWSRLRNLAHFFMLEASTAIQRGDLNVGVRTSLEILELANAVRRGGLIVDLQLGLMIGSHALEVMRKVRNKLGADARAHVIDRLYRIESEREPFAEIVARDRAWEVAVGWGDRTCDTPEFDLIDPEECGLSENEQKEILGLIQQIATLPDAERQQLIRVQDEGNLALMRMMEIDLALREFRAATGRLPEKLSALVPQPFERLPLDPFTGQPFIYRPSADESFCLYSTGPKLFDGGGHFGPWPAVSAGCADLCLDNNDYWPADDCVRKKRGLLARMTSRLSEWWHSRRLIASKI
ncbi:MAG: hypothetical protein ACTHOU_03915 [Aureliella sp.]